MCLFPPTIVKLLFALFRACEHGAPWPKHWIMAKVSMLAKTETPSSAFDARPITVFSVLYRQWSRYRSREILAYFTSFMPKEVALATNKVPADLAAALVGLRIENSINCLSPLCGIGIDLVRCFNTLPRFPLYQVLRKMGVPERYLVAWEGVLSQMTRTIALGVGIFFNSVENLPQNKQEPVEPAKRRRVSIPGRPPASRADPPEHPRGPRAARVPVLRADRVLRTSTMEQRKQRDEMKAATAASAAAATSSTPKRERKTSTLTQEARLREAVLTEERNREEFKILQRQDDERRRSRRGRRRATPYDGPRIRFVSRLQPPESTPSAPLIGAAPGAENFVNFIDCRFEDFCGNGMARQGAAQNDQPLETASKVQRRGERKSAAAPKKMTLWPFQQVECHSLPFTRLFVASRCSLAYCLWVLCAILLLVIPLFATFATDNVWVKESFYRAQPVVAFTNELFLIASGDTVNSAVGWSTQPSLQSLLPSEVKVPLVRSSFSDRNHDGIADVLKLSVELPSSGRRNLVLLAVYQVQVQGKVSEELSGLLALDLSSPYLASGVSVHGQLIFRQKLPLFQSVEVRRLYAESPLVVNWTSSWTPENQPLTLEALLGRYAQRTLIPKKTQKRR
eukprot:symbB.v1.2.004949.t1/scaffold272.1/size248367/4